MTTSRRFMLGTAAAAAFAMGSLIAVAPAYAGIVLFEHENYNAQIGQSLNIGSGHRSSLPGFNDKTTSFTISGGYTVQLWEHTDYKGCKTTVWEKSKPDLRKYAFCSGGNWSDKTSSVR